jgi:hypothetical protein
MQEVKMKMWRLCFLFLICSGLYVAIGLGGCGDDNPCENAEPSTCASIQYAVPDSCLVIEKDDFACLCCAPPGEDGIPCDTVTGDPADADLITAWNEDTKTCYVEEE